MRFALVIGTVSCLAVAACGGEGDAFEAPVFGGPGAGGGGVSPPPNGTLPQTGPTQPNECGGVTVSAKHVPLYIVVALDRSNSMGNSGKWEAATNGLSAFFEAQHPSVYASLSLFPQVAKSCDGNYVAPAVPMAALPSTAFRATFAQTGLLGGTPIRPALEGAANYAYSLQQQAGASARVVVALVSDGAPSSKLCSGNTLTDVVATAKAAANAGVLTYAIGMPGALQGNLDQIALAGGTVQGTLLNATDPGGQLTATFNQIRNQFSCDVQLPALSQSGTSYAPDQVNVVYTPSGGAASTVPYSVGCSNPEGWSYDNAASPSAIKLCAQACARAAADGEIDVKLGCTTQGDRPR